MNVVEPATLYMTTWYALGIAFVALGFRNLIDRIWYTPPAPRWFIALEIIGGLALASWAAGKIVQ